MITGSIVLEVKTCKFKTSLLSYQYIISRKRQPFCSQGDGKPRIFKVFKKTAGLPKEKTPTLGMLGFFISTCHHGIREGERRKKR